MWLESKAKNSSPSNFHLRQGYGGQAMRPTVFSSVGDNIILDRKPLKRDRSALDISPVAKAMGDKPSHELLAFLVLKRIAQPSPFAESCIIN